MFVVHPRDPALRRVDRDFAFIMSAYRIDPGTSLPKVAEMTDFNMWTWNSRVFPGIDPLPVRLGDRVRVRIGNLTMTNHPCGASQVVFAQQGLIEGQVTKVDPSAAKITIKHGPIPKLDMDIGMTMVFAVSDPKILRTVKAGDRSKFDAERVNGQLTVTKLQKAR